MDWITLFNNTLSKFKSIKNRYNDKILIKYFKILDRYIKLEPFKKINKYLLYLIK